MAASNHAKAIKDFLDSKGHSDVKPRPPLRGSQEGIFIIPTGGPPPSSFFSGSEVHKMVALQILVVANPNNPQASDQTARSIYNDLTDAKPSGYLRVKMRQPSPIFLGVDSEERMRWSINILAEIVE